MLVAQAVNFGILLVVLTLFVYRPLMKAMEERRKKIELGVKGGELAEQIISEAEEGKQQKLREADKEAVAIIAKAEKEAGARGNELLAQAAKKSAAVLSEAEQIAESKKAEELAKLSAEASVIVRSAIAKAVEMNPDAIDSKLVETAAKIIAQTNK